MTMIKITALRTGACYGTRVVLGVAVGLPVSVGCDLSYAAGHLMRYGQVDLMPLGSVGTAVAVLAGTGLVILAETLRHTPLHHTAGGAVMADPTDYRSDIYAGTEGAPADRCGEIYEHTGHSSGAFYDLVELSETDGVTR